MKQINEKTWQSDNGLITFIHGDCMEFMAGCKEKEFDLNVSDPPYGIGVNKQTLGNGKRKLNRGARDWDNQSPDKILFDKIISTSKNQILFGANHYISKIPYDSSCWLFWDKGTGENDYADGELAWTSFKSVVKKKFISCVGANAKQKTDKDRIHINEKPIDLYRWIFTNYAKPTDRILDCFGGSMSSAIAAHMEGLRMTIIELDEEYFQRAIKRFATYESQQTISFDL